MKFRSRSKITGIFCPRDWNPVLVCGADFKPVMPYRLINEGLWVRFPLQSPLSDR